jgi:lipoprotein-anchoring transpeptidase ErfK/SrfK
MSDAELADAYPWFITISIQRKELRLYERLQLVGRYRLGLGAPGYETKSGRFSITSKHVRPDWLVPDNPRFRPELVGRLIRGGTPANAVKERWLGVYSQVGIHGSYEVGWLGIRSSVGCIRMSVPDVIELFDRVPEGTPVFIA